MWFHNLSNGMDQESLNKWKEEFQNERQEQFTKVKQLQKDTQKRRKQMEVKRKLDAAKEEKRRREALAERRAVHVEATMRFQKGIKNFRVSKEKISLEDALKSLNKRTNSADTSLLSPNHSSTHSDVYNLLSNPHQQQQQQHRSKSASFNVRNHMRKSSSFNDVNALLANYHNNNNNINIAQLKQQQQQQQQQELNNQFFASNNTTTTTLTNTNNNNVISKQNDDIYNNNNNNNKRSDNNNNNNNLTTTSNITQNVINTNNPGSNFKIILEENQKTIQNFNKEALNEFKNTIMSEIKSADAVHQSNIKTTEIPKINNTFTKHVLNTEGSNFMTSSAPPVSTITTTNFFLNNNNQTAAKNVTTSSTDELEFNEEAIINDDLSSISNSLSDSEDSLEIQTTKHHQPRVKSATISTGAGSGIGLISGTITHNHGVKAESSQGNNSRPPATVVQVDSFSSNPLSNIKNHFLTKTLTTEFLTNSLLANKKTYYAPTQPPNNNETATTLSERIVPSKPSSASSGPKSSTSSQQQAPKSILKRSSSDNSLHLIGTAAHNNPFVHFGINGKAEKLEVKDSLEVATNRLKSSNSTVANNGRDSAGRKKSVRFAHHFGESNGDGVDNESNITQEDDMSSIAGSSSSNKRPSVKPRASLNNKKPTAAATIGYNELQILNDSNLSNNSSKPGDGRPPLPPTPTSAYASDNSYLLISQKRKEFLDKFRNKSGFNEFLTSPKSPHDVSTTSINSNMSSKPPRQPATTTNEFNSSNNEHYHHQQQPVTSIKFQINDQVQFNNNGHRHPEEKKNGDNVINTYNSKYGFNTMETSNKQAGGGALLTRNNNNNNNNNEFDSTQQQQNHIINGNNRKFPAKPLVKGHSTSHNNITTNLIEIQQLNNNNLLNVNYNNQQQQQQRRPFSANTPLTNENSGSGANVALIANAISQNNLINHHSTPQQQQQQQVPRINTKLMTFNVTAPASPQRILSADSASNQQFRYKKYMNSPMIQLKIQYPENMKYTPHGTDENVTISMDEFLKAEQMCNTQLTESRVMNMLDNIQQNKSESGSSGSSKPPMTTLSIEEQNVKNSIQKLNDKLNLLNRKTHTGLRRNYN